MNEYAATLSIDLGASYTKVSYRPKLPQGDRPQSETAAKILILEFQGIEWLPKRGHLAET
jgi:hypothetical protein